ncbi:MAG: hypothetical protein KBF66_01290 [Rhodoferax sp.]|uniref:hypothetical protein n=1 Tax=Rhodoferax sp. TaxID=50421 RepID=UPI001B6BE308|nr:hypothetical protein [Rhodoferax sp.]MBP9904160.1 hypothetical protein [Rhodoferax sp.]
MAVDVVEVVAGDMDTGAATVELDTNGAFEHAASIHMMADAAQSDCLELVFL